MSRKITIAVCVVLFVLLVALMVCEYRWPEGGVNLMESLFH